MMRYRELDTPVSRPVSLRKLSRVESVAAVQKLPNKQISGGVDDLADMQAGTAGCRRFLICCNESNNDRSQRSSKGKNGKSRT